jgi:hypothetical protein
MAGRWNQRRIVRHLVIGAAAAAILSLGVCNARATVVIFDGFGDADLDNDGMALEMNDVDVSGAGDGAVGPYVALGDEGSPELFPLGTMVDEVTEVENASDLGIKWFSIGQWTSATPPDTPDPRASVHIINDAAGALPETKPLGFFHAARNARSVAEAIDDGLALAVEAKGRTQPAAGFFNETIELGNAVGDEVKLSFDFRIWYSAPNFNENSLNHVPRIGDFRFGIYQDSDGQLGTINPFAGPGNTGPATWGAAHGDFRGDDGTVGANGDRGWFVRVPIDDPNTTAFDQLSANIARINEETNEGATGTNPQIMNGNTDFVADPEDNPGTLAFPERGIDINKVYNFALSLKRFDDPETEGTTGDTIFATFTVTERATGQQWTFGEYDSLDETGTSDPDGGFESDSWDYFAMQTAGTTTSDDFDWIIDNFTVEVIGSNAGLLGDYNNDGSVDAADYVVWRKNNINGQQGYNDWRTNFGRTAGSGEGLFSAAIPEPSSAALMLIGAVLTGCRRRCKHLRNASEPVFIFEN